MKIGIDARFIGPGGTGLGKYTEKLIVNLAKIDKKNEYCIFLRRENW
ncbi:glycosyltransferase family 1 protein, partial [Candidatus Curtissbacteria bacterium]|nr:glycosyltransferase family 1 protein [Candidatus Curtissbacteria bacterium]